LGRPGEYPGTPAADCCTPSAHGLARYEDALAGLLARARPLVKVESVPLASALGRVLARDVVSSLNVPPWDNSAMDGYALRVADLAAGGALPISQRIPAGAWPGPLEPGTAARIFTGAPVPEGADAVVMQEVCEERDDRVRVDAAVAPGANIRRAGEDIRTGDTVLTRGIRLTPQALGLAASVGAAQLEVLRRPRVALFSTGDELAEPGEALPPGGIYNSNRYTLIGLLAALGAEVVDLGRVADTFEATREALARGADCDVILTSGGVSVGDEDHVKAAVESMGEINFWRAAIKPGKPVAFGRIVGGKGEADFIGLPGNPVSVFVTFCLFARPFLLARMGVAHTAARAWRVRADFERSRADKRRDFLRAALSQGKDSAWWAKPYRSASSGVLSSVQWADGLLVVPECATVARGDWLDFLPFSELLG
jgi:molybdopterin molybdotransferase